MERDPQQQRNILRLLAIALCGLIVVACNRSNNKATVPTDASSKSPPSESTGTPASPAVDGENKTAVSATKDSAAPAKSSSAHHEPLFEGWPQPKFVFLVTGQQMGYIEPCGCTGLVNQKGGLARRHTLAKELEARGWPVVPIDVGNQIKRFGRQSEIKFQTTSEALKKIGYKAIALGSEDLRLSVGELAAQTFAGDGQPSPFLSANTAILDASLTPQFHVVEIAGKKVGITSAVSEELQKKIIGGEIILKSPDEGLAEVMPKLREAKCDVLVLLAQASIVESKAWAQKYPEFQIIVTAGGLGEPTFEPEPIEGTKAILVQVGLKGMFAGVVGVFDDPEKPYRYQRVPLDDRFKDSADMLALMAAYQEQLQAAGFEGLGVKPVPHPTGRAFVGSEKCGECHTKAFDSWKKSKHAHATESLVHPGERSEIARHFDPECLSCHVTGWNPQQFFPYESGYLALEKTPLMQGSGCENCHGPGSAHVTAEESQAATDVLKTAREAMRLPLAAAEKKCQECHDLDNSPDFHDPGAFDKYWKEIEHIGKD